MQISASTKIWILTISMHKESQILVRAEHIKLNNQLYIFEVSWERTEGGVIFIILRESIIEVF